MDMETNGPFFTPCAPLSNAPAWASVTAGLRTSSMALCRALTFHHPRLKIWESYYRGNTQGGDRGNRFVHCSICKGVISSALAR